MARPRNNPNGLNSAWNNGRNWVSGQFNEHETRSVASVAAAVALITGIAIGAASENSNSSESRISIDSCPTGYIAQSAGTAGAAIRRFGRAQSELNTRVNLLSENNGNADTLKRILNTFGDTSVHDLGAFVCQGFAGNQPEMMLSPHAESVLGELEGVGVEVPPYTHASNKK